MTYPKMLMLAALFVATYTSSAHAQDFTGGDFQAQISPFTPVAAGSSITLDACGSNVFGHSICDSSDLSDLTVFWSVRPEGTGLFSDQNRILGNYNWIPGRGLILAGTSIWPTGSISSPDLTGNTGGNIGTQLTISTANTNFFPAPGNYIVNLSIGIYNQASITFDNVSGSPTVHNNHRDRGRAFVARAEATFTAATASVPEPEAFLLLFPALAFMAVRRRKMKKTATI